MRDREAIREWRKRYFAQKAERGLCINCKKPRVPNQNVCKAHLKARRQWQREHGKPQSREYLNHWRKQDQIKKRKIVIAHYGNACACCGETELVFLTIDHKEGNGCSDPRTRGPAGFKMTGYNWYARIIKLGFPDDLQALCWNCNEAKRLVGTCPHERVRHLSPLPCASFSSENHSNTRATADIADTENETLDTGHCGGNERARSAPSGENPVSSDGVPVPVA